MRVLAFDCAGAQCAAAVVADGRALAQTRIDGERGHAQVLIPQLIQTLADAGLTLRDVDRIAVTTGPGSFTGIRVALAAAHGLALALDIEIVGVTVFEAVAAAAGKPAAATPGLPACGLAVAIESRRADIFVQIFDADGLATGAPALASPADVAGWVLSRRLALAGDAAPRIRDFLPPDSTAILAGAVDPAVLGRIAAGRAPGPPPAPFYLRAADAKPKLQ